MLAILANGGSPRPAGILEINSRYRSAAFSLHPGVLRPGNSEKCRFHRASLGHRKRGLPAHGCIFSMSLVSRRSR